MAGPYRRTSRGSVMNPTQSKIQNPKTEACILRAVKIRVLCALGLLAAALAACRRDSRVPLVLYSPHGRDLLGLVERTYESKHPDVDVRWLDMGSQEVYDRVRSEKANPQADVWLGGPSTIFARGVRDGLLEPFDP